MSTRRNEFLDHNLSEESDAGSGYDSEAAEILKGTKSSTTERSNKRRKLSHSSHDEELDDVGTSKGSNFNAVTVVNEHLDGGRHEEQEREGDEDSEAVTVREPTAAQNSPNRLSQTHTQSKKKSSDKEVQPGVVYMSSLPPYLKPSALRNLLSQRGFKPITRLFLTPASKAKSSSKKNSRQLYSEGWIEFASKKTARRCAESLNTQIIGGKKGGFYHDDIWNMKYLKGMGWSELMAGIREEKREEEGRRDEERRQIARETKRFVEGVEEGKRVEGIKRKRSGKARKGDESGQEMDGDVKRTWRQFEVKGQDTSGRKEREKDKISNDVKEVLGKIF